MLDRVAKAEPYFVYLRNLIREGFSGNVKVNFFEGGITSLNKKGELIIKVDFNETVKIK